MDSREAALIRKIGRLEVELAEAKTDLRLYKEELTKGMPERQVIELVGGSMCTKHHWHKNATCDYEEIGSGSKQD